MTMTSFNTGRVGDRAGALIGVSRRHV